MQVISIDRTSPSQFTTMPAGSVTLKALLAVIDQPGPRVPTNAEDAAVAWAPGHGGDLVPVAHAEVPNGVEQK